MDWKDAIREKQELMEKTVESLDDRVHNLLVYVLTQEKNNKGRNSWRFRNPIRDRLNYLVPQLTTTTPTKGKS